MVLKDKWLIYGVFTLDMMLPILRVLFLLAERADIDLVAIVPALHGSQPFCREDILTRITVDIFACLSFEFRLDSEYFLVWSLLPSVIEVFSDWQVGSETLE
jgi:hypothetical protein